MNEVQAKQITAILAAAYPAWRPNEATLQLYELVIAPLPAALAERAVLEMIHSRREFAPPAGLICERVARLAAGADLSAEEAWNELQAAIRAHGCYRAPRLHNRALQAAVGAMSWGEICTNPNIEATRAHFFRLFERFLEREVARQVETFSAGAGLRRLTQSWSGVGAETISTRS